MFAVCACVCVGVCVDGAADDVPCGHRANTAHTIHIIMKLNARPNGLPYGWRKFTHRRIVAVRRQHAQLCVCGAACLRTNALYDSRRRRRHLRILCAAVARDFARLNGISTDRCVANISRVHI